MGLKVFVDDLRACPDGWIPARTVTEAIRILATQDVEAVSLDHDIQIEVPETPGSDLSPIRFASLETFEAVAYYLSLYEESRKAYRWSTASDQDIVVHFHAGSPEMGKKMADIIGVPYKFTHYPYDFRKDRDVKEPWEGENE